MPYITDKNGRPHWQALKMPIAPLLEIMEEEGISKNQLIRRLGGDDHDWKHPMWKLVMNTFSDNYREKQGLSPGIALYNADLMAIKGFGRHPSLIWEDWWNIPEEEWIMASPNSPEGLALRKERRRKQEIDKKARYRKAKRTYESPIRDAVYKWVTEYLADGPKEYVDVVRAGLDAGFTKRQVDMVSDKTVVTKKKVGHGTGIGCSSTWSLTERVYAASFATPDDHAIAKAEIHERRSAIAYKVVANGRGGYRYFTEEQWNAKLERERKYDKAKRAKSRMVSGAVD